jgi:putative endonuclease
MRSYWTYIRASKPHGTLYIGVTNDLVHRIDQHRAGKGSAFTRRYSVHTLVWFEEFARARDAIQREKKLAQALPRIALRGHVLRRALRHDPPELRNHPPSGPFAWQSVPA